MAETKNEAMELIEDTNHVLELIDRYKEALEVKDTLAEATKRNNEDATALRDQLAQAMIDAEIDQIGRHGFNWRLKATTRYSKKGGMDEELFSVLRDHGLGGLIRETVNANTLQGAMSEIARENDDELPDEFKEVINVYEYMDISRRKAPTAPTF